MAMNESDSKPPLAQDVTTEPSKSSVEPVLQRDDSWVKEMFEDIQHQLAEFEQRRQQSMNEMRSLAVELAIAVTEKLVLEKIDESQFPFQNLIGQLVDQSPHSACLQLSLNPDDLQLLSQQIENSHDENKAFGNLKLTADGRLPRGRFHIDSGDNEYFYDIAMHLAEIRRTIMENLNESEIERRAADRNAGSLRRFPDRRSVG